MTGHLRLGPVCIGIDIVELERVGNEVHGEPQAMFVLLRGAG
jgi:hypothetical protein